ncbi:hypothetical protein NC653_015238 [Populus alba x Populus x berolinensis]|uniref:Transmembrane protein n=1 Tax=Populus alba x Populus x berolinensis TaxID=444605 RepID=A0AAD6QJZ5_9ROSI|nr:hypothetical protein NC653_015238 [Populus alba x Populus x berolinensis]
MEIMKRKVVGDDHLFQGKKIQAKLPVKPRQLWLYLWSYLLPKIRCCRLLYDLYFSLFMDFLLSPVSSLLFFFSLRANPFKSPTSTYYSLLAIKVRVIVLYKSREKDEGERIVLSIICSSPSLSVIYIISSTVSVLVYTSWCFSNGIFSAC